MMLVERKIKHVDLWYPRLKGHDNAIQVGLDDVRAADSILIEYDFQRDGWVISQQTKFFWTAEEVEADPTLDPLWKEVAFIPSWQFYTGDDE